MRANRVLVAAEEEADEVCDSGPGMVEPDRSSVPLQPRYLRSGLSSDAQYLLREFITKYRC